MTFAIIQIIFFVIGAVIIGIDAIISISSLVKMDKETFMTYGIDEMIGTVAEIIIIMFVIMSLFKIL